MVLPQRFFYVSILATGLAFAPARANEQVRVSIMDGGSDLDHRTFSRTTFKNMVEQTGHVGLDDDHNGYIDDISGWDLVAGNADYFPRRSQKFFDQHATKIDAGFALNDLVESGDRRAQLDLARNQELESITYEALDHAHGTHVAGIVREVSQDSVWLDATNVVNEPDDEGPSVYEERNALQSSKADSFYSDRAAIETYLKNIRRDDIVWAASVNQYLKVFNPRIVNISLGVSYNDLVENEDQYWRDEIRERKLRSPVNRTNLEDKNRSYLINAKMELSKKLFVDMFRSNPHILFIAAAGNSSINTDIETNYPPNLSLDFANVMAIAATEDNGQLADFSSYSKTYVDLAAPGVAVSSAAPGNRQVKMSGTSMSAPFVSGVAARVLQINPALRPVEVRALLNAATKPYEDLIGVVKSAGVLMPERAYGLAEKSLALRSNFTLGIFQNFGNRLLYMFRQVRHNLQWDQVSKSEHIERRSTHRVPKLKSPTHIKNKTVVQ